MCRLSPVSGLPRLLALIRATHPAPTVAVTVGSGLLAAAVGHPAAGVAGVTATVLASQLAIGWSNDAIDAGRDRAAGRTDKPLVTGAVSRPTVAVGAAVAAVATVLLAAQFGAAAATAMYVGLLGGLAYNWPLKRTAASVVPYAVSFAALPAFVVLALPATPPAWLLAAGALLGAGAHFANVLPDLADDAATGVRGLPHRLGPTGAAGAAAGLLLAATAVLVLGPDRATAAGSALGPVVLAVVAGVLLAGWLRSRTAGTTGGRRTALFHAVLLVALINVGLLLLAGAGG